MTIYFISKRTDPLTLYVGKSMDGISLERSLQNHMKEKKRNPNSKFYQWLDDSCKISSLTTYESNPDTQYDFIRMFIKYGYNVLNKIHK